MKQSINISDLFNPTTEKSWLFEEYKKFNMKQQTAVEWLEEQYNLGNGFERILTKSDFEKAKEMEKQQLINAFVECWKANMPDGCECKLSAEQYYNETYENTNGTSIS